MEISLSEGSGKVEDDDEGIFFFDSDVRSFVPSFVL